MAAASVIAPGDPAIVAVLMAFFVVGTLAPDLDAMESKLKHARIGRLKPFVPVARAFNRDFGHRGSLHSLCGWLIWTILILPWGTVIGWLSIAALSLGYASHLAGDACTRTGIPLLYPIYPKRTHYFLLPRRILVVTGSEYEELFFEAFALSSIILLLTRLSI